MIPLWCYVVKQMRAACFLVPCQSHYQILWLAPSPEPAALSELKRLCKNALLNAAFDGMLQNLAAAHKPPLRPSRLQSHLPLPRTV